MKIGIYGIKNLVNGKWYVGQSICLNTRKQLHFASLKRGDHHNDYLQKSFNKYGINNFEFHILEEVPEDMLDVKECSWIAFYKSTQDQFGYNLDSGGNLNHHHTDKSREKMSKAQKGRIPWICGKHHSPATCQKISDARKGIVFSKEHHENLSKAHQGVKRPAFSKEHKNRIAESMKGKNKGRIHSLESRLNMSIAHQKHHLIEREL